MWKAAAKFSSLAKAIPRREHKERVQPSWRKGVGPLEKHKDYVVRSRKTHQKNAKLQLLRSLAANKNSEEYYRDMKFAHKTDKGATIIEKLPSVTSEEQTIITKRKQKQFIKQNASHNLNLLRHKHSIVLKKIEKMKNTLHFLDVVNQDEEEEPQQQKYKLKAKHIVFANEDEFDNFDPSKRLNCDIDSINRLSKTLVKTNPVAIDGAALKQYEALEKLMEKEKILRKTINEVSMALHVAIEPENIEKFERDEEHENKNLTGKLKNVVAVKFKKERMK
jgi:hypothetical protein